MAVRRRIGAAMAWGGHHQGRPGPPATNSVGVGGSVRYHHESPPDSAVDSLNNVDAWGVLAWMDNYREANPLDNIATAAADFRPATPEVTPYCRQNEAPARAAHGTNMLIAALRTRK